MIQCLITSHVRLNVAYNTAVHAAYIIGHRAVGRVLTALYLRYLFILLSDFEKSSFVIIVYHRIVGVGCGGVKSLTTSWKAATLYCQMYWEFGRPENQIGVDVVTASVCRPIQLELNRAGLLPYLRGWVRLRQLTDDRIAGYIKRILCADDECYIGAASGC